MIWEFQFREVVFLPVSAIVFVWLLFWSVLLYFIHYFCVVLFLTNAFVYIILQYLKL